ncbi:MAG: hypothetical protein A2Y25_10865 [Candidatus Melainabacteria bacterium GWF2_37_15]|nr:MAG: hypothetical protein A2Y25_10865 [Candidatus Melainabacteria bacterium GWF2_37_15]
MKNKIAGFSLAEVLLVIIILGVVASETIPVLVTNFQNKTLRTAWKKQYTVLAQAHKLLMLSYDSTNMSNLPICVTSSCMAQAYIHRSGLKIYRDCGYTNDAQASGCLSDKWYGYEGNVIDDIAGFTSGGIILWFMDGSTINVSGYNEACNDISLGAGMPFCARLIVDVNGPKAPNKLGLDIYFIFVTKDGIKPSGSTDWLGTVSPCSTVDDGGYANGYACSAEVLKGSVE